MRKVIVLAVAIALVAAGWLVGRLAGPLPAAHAEAGKMPPHAVEMVIDAGAEEPLKETVANVVEWDTHMAGTTAYVRLTTSEGARIYVNADRLALIRAQPKAGAGGGGPQGAGR